MTLSLKDLISMPLTKIPYKMERTFWPVGQGLFCSERFIDSDGETSTVAVYDCGSINRIPWKYIDEKFIPDKNNIDLLFISHFHKDHLNGVAYLLKHYDVENILLPVISTSQFAESYIYNVITTKKTIPLVNSLLVGLVKGTVKNKIVRVQSSSEIRPAGGDSHFFAPSQFPDVLTPGTGIDIDDWIYLPFNHMEPVEYADFENDLKETFPDLYKAFVNVDEIEIKNEISKILNQDLEKGSKKELTALYKRHFKNMNCSSMAVYSGPRNVHDQDGKTDSCLYTGDYPMRYEKYLDDIKLFYNYYWNSIGTMQVPHHGSDDDNPKSLYDTFDNRTCVISAGKKAPKHPGRQALINIVISTNYPVLVTDDQNKQYSQPIQIVK